MGYVDEVLADAPVGYWRLNEASGLPQDSSGNGLHMTASSGTGIYAQPGPLTSEVSKAINLNASAAFNRANDALLDVGGTFTIETWIKLNAMPSGNGCVMSKGGGAWALLLDGGGSGQYPRMFKGGYLSGLITPATAMYDLNWHHLAVVMDSATHRIYVDGVQVHSQAITALTNTTGNLYIGTGDFAPNQTQLSEVALYPTALPQGRILAHLLAAGGTYEEQVLAAGPRAYYHMNEASGLIQDSSGNANHATSVSGTPTYAQTGAILTEPTEKAINLNNGPYFSVPDHATLDVGDVFTLEAWIKLNTLTPGVGLQTIISKGTGSFALVLDGGTGKTMRLVHSNVAYINTASVAFSDLNWHHVVATKDGGTHELYIDGVDVGGGTGAGAIGNNSLPLQIGADNSALPAQMSIDEVAVYPRALTAAEVRAHYLAGVVTTYAEVVAADVPAAWYRMKETSGLIQDSSGNANHATSSTGTAGYAQASPIVSEEGDTAVNLAAGPWFSVPDSATLDVTDTFTVEAWIKRNSTGAGYAFIVSKGSTAYSLYLNSSALFLGQSGVGPVQQSNITISDTKWHHVVAIKTPGTTGKVYIDGVDVSTAGTLRALANNAAVLAIGSEPGFATTDMAMDEVAVYPTALSPARVLAHYWAALKELEVSGPTIVTPDTGIFTLSGLAPAAKQRISVSVRTYAYSGLTAAKLIRRATPSTGVANFSGLVASTRVRLYPVIGQAVFTGIAGTVRTRATPDTARYQFYYLAVTPPTLRYIAKPSVGVITFSGPAPYVPEPPVPQVVSVRSQLVWAK